MRGPLALALETGLSTCRRPSHPLPMSPTPSMLQRRPCCGASLIIKCSIFHGKCKNLWMMGVALFDWWICCGLRITTSSQTTEKMCQI
jgi:hypothetical protein